MTVRDLIALLQTNGWVQVRTRGSHRRFQHPSRPGTVTIAGKPGVDVPAGTLNSALKQRGLERLGANTACAISSKSRDAVVTLIRAAIALHIESLRQDGEPVPPPSSSSEIVDVAAV